MVNDNSYGSGCAWGDYNNDCRLDLIVTSYNDFGSSGYPHLYQNLGNDNFTSITNSIIVTNSLEQTLACAWGDYNHDGKLDLIVATGYNQPELLYKNIGGGNFERITAGDIVNNNGHSGGINWCDYNKDGFLDVLIVRQGYNLLYRGNCDGTFTRITDGPIVTDYGNHRRATWGDYNNDHYPDLYVANYDNQPGNLYLNNRNGTFTKIAQGEIVNTPAYGSGCAWGDYNNDGYLDLYVTNDDQNNFLYRNNGNGTFTKITNDPTVTGVGASFGCNWGDYDNDGYLDLFVANNLHEQNWLFHNNGNGTFTKISGEAIVQDVASSVGSSVGDYNNDGKLDIFVVNQGYYGGPPENDCLYKNVGAGPYYLIVKLCGGGIGSRITLRIGNHLQIREVSGGSGCSSEDMLWQHFGLGFLAGSDISTADSVIVDWNDGYREFMTNVPINQQISFNGTVGINQNQQIIPKEFQLMQNYPNPFNPATTIEYALIKNTKVKISIYDILGRQIKTLVNDFEDAGYHSINFNASNLSSGIYFYKIETDQFTNTKKMILSK